MIVLAGGICLVTLCVLLLVVWNVLAWPGLTKDVADAPGAVSVLIPARNEEDTLGACLESVLHQGPTVAEVLVYNDHSTDGTTVVIEPFRKRDARVRLLAPLDLPQGWCGKNFACARLAAAARSEWLLFLDADARLERNSLARMVAEVRTRDVTLLSSWPGFVLAGFWEKLLMPMLNFLVFTLFPAPLSLKRGETALGLAHGACLLVHRETYARVGGHESVRSEIFEDTRIARLWRQHGKRGICLDGQDAVRVRMYGSFREIWRGFRKNFYPAFHHQSLFWMFLLFHAAFFLVPFACVPMLMGGIHGGLLLAVASVLVLTIRTLLALRFGQPLWSVLGHPIAQGLLIALGVASWWRCATGKGVDWKGREYRVSH